MAAAGVAQAPGSIPARAGETGHNPEWSPKPGVYPRTGGGNPAGVNLDLPDDGLSPHGRGKLDGHAFTAGRLRSIPARAGETLSRPLWR